MVRVAKKSIHKAIGKMMPLLSVDEVLTDRFETTSQPFTAFYMLKKGYRGPMRVG